MAEHATSWAIRRSRVDSRLAEVTQAVQILR